MLISGTISQSCYDRRCNPDPSNHLFTFPSFQIQPGQTCRVYTNQNHPQYCGFNYGSGSAIWNNGGDTATLRDGEGTVVDVYTYP